ncbi:radical SAM protein [Chakrabartyella piscis]|uniref:radical SAM protein n=1 Tax=Chakrabartyella piscis TaxID=2918914 RepID=UPI0029586638|nr:radical SAM protein [Chakrabartyella piscis]
MDNEIENRYSVITEKNKREIVLIRGNGCRWRKCRFCDYHLDSSTNQEENDALNAVEIGKITGIYSKLEVINSGSFVDLSETTMNRIVEVCVEKKIAEVHFECHWMHKEAVALLRKRFADLGIRVKIKIGVETFDALFRESYLMKGIDTDVPAEIAAYFDECCLLQGIPGQTAQTMTRDIETGLEHFDRVCVNIMQENGKPIKPDPRVIEAFVKEVYPKYKDNVRVDILLENTAFGVGGVTTNAK